MDALTLLLIVDMCNREHEVTGQIGKPATYQTYKETYPYIVSAAALDQVRTANASHTEILPG